MKYNAMLQNCFVSPFEKRRINGRAVVRGKGRKVGQMEHDLGMHVINYCNVLWNRDEFHMYIIKFSFTK